MAKKTASTSPKEKAKKEKPFCKELGCFDEAGIKGYCRLHFLKNLYIKSQKPVETDEHAAPSDRRRKNRNSKLIPVTRAPNEAEADPGNIPFESDEAAPSSLHDFDSAHGGEDAHADSEEAEASVRKAG